MRFLGLAALGLMMTVGAFADTVLIPCGTSGGGWSFSAGTGTFTSANSANTGSVTCPAYSTLPPGYTFTSLGLVIETDYSGGSLATTNTIQTTYSGAVLTTEVLTSTSAPGTGPSDAYSASPGLPNYSSFASYFIANTSETTYPTTAFDVAFSSVVTGGSVQSESGQVYELVTYAASTPEPGSMMLLGTGLVAFAFVGRKFARKSK